MPITSIPVLAGGITGHAPTPTIVAGAVQPQGEAGAIASAASGARNTIVVPSLADYRILVSKVLDDVAEGHSEARNFDNYGAGHASIVVEEMLVRAKEFVHCFAQRLSADVFSIEFFSAFLKRCPEARVEIVVEESDVLSDPFSALYQAHEFVGDPRVYLGLYKPPFAVEHVTNVDNKLARIEISRKERTASVVASNAHASAIADAEALFQEVRRLSVPIHT